MSKIAAETLLAKILKTDEDAIKKALILTNDYKEVECKKRGGGYRKIFIPSDHLKSVQKKINKSLLQKLREGIFFDLYGIYPGTSYVQHAQRHKNAKWVFQFDLKDAFPSVNVSSLRGILFRTFQNEMKSFESSFSLYRNISETRTIEPEEPSYFCEELVAKSVFFSLQNLMIKEGDDWSATWTFPQSEELISRLTDLIMELTTYQSILPQGTPTAPFLFYLALTEEGLFRRIHSLFPMIYPKRYRFEVSAYIDNFVISSQKPIPEEKQEKLFGLVEEFGFKVNPAKTRHQGIMHVSPLITGLRVVNENGKGKIALPKEKVRRYRGLIHRAIFEPELRPKVKGLIASLIPIYGSRKIPDEDFFAKHSRYPMEPILPSQLEKPYRKLLQKIEQEQVQHQEDLSQNTTR